MGQDQQRPPHREVNVRDKPLEGSVNFNTILTALLLAAILWVGNTLESIKDKLGDFSTSIALNTNNISLQASENRELRRRLEEHVNDKARHRNN